MKINYTFNNGENSEVEVNEEIGAVILESRRKEENMERNRRRRCYSLDDVDFEGDDFADERTPESLFMEQLDNEHIKETLDKLSETQRRRLLMYAEGMSIEDIARVEGVYHTSISRSIEAARKIFLKNF
ncbi:MAG: sigma factor-like helix-turn-helix DNA-binding protein [Acutalibacteraceae bacterium]|nr:sigma factor-like helix-turn-helix DNA-binding protein [Acutalibacteraceae bacterium]